MVFLVLFIVRNFYLFLFCCVFCLAQALSQEIIKSYPALSEYNGVCYMEIKIDDKLPVNAKYAILFTAMDRSSNDKGACNGKQASSFKAITAENCVFAKNTFCQALTNIDCVTSFLASLYVGTNEVAAIPKKDGKTIIGNVLFKFKDTTIRLPIIV